MAILIEGMEMPKTGLYFVGVDNTNGRDKTVITVERMLGNRDVRQIIGSFELITVPPHGDLIDRAALRAEVKKHATPPDAWVFSLIRTAPTIIQSSEEGE